MVGYTVTPDPSLPRLTSPSYNTTDPALPSYVRPEFVTYLPDLTLVVDLLEGTRRMWNQASAYIRKWADEDLKVWTIRARCEQVYEGLGRTISASIGMLFAKEPELEWGEGGAEGIIGPDWDNIDGSGTKGHVFLKRFAETAIRDGTSAILVDHPSAPIDPVTKKPIEITAANEAEFRLRPTWSSYPRTNILSWRTSNLHNQDVLTQIVFWEPSMVADGNFGVKSVNRYRVLRLIPGVGATWSLWESVKGGSRVEDFTIVGSGFFKNRNGEIANFLPVAIAHTGRREALLVSTIPLLGVAWANLGHWQISSNYRFYLDLAAFPQPTIIGELAKSVGPEGVPVAGKLKLGPLVVVHLSGEGADFKYTGPPVEAFSVLEKAIMNKERQMAKLGMSFLAVDTRQAETAEAKRLDASSEQATLATAAQGIDDATNQAFVYHSWFVGIDKENAPTFTINRDFESTAMDPQTMGAYVQAVKDAGLPPRMLLEAWQSGGRIPPDVNLDELEMEMLAAAEAAEEKKRQAALAMQANSQPGIIPEDEEEEVEEEV